MNINDVREELTYLKTQRTPGQTAGCEFIEWPTRVSVNRQDYISYLEEKLEYLGDLNIERKLFEERNTALIDWLESEQDFEIIKKESFVQNAVKQEEGDTLGTKIYLQAKDSTFIGKMQLTTTLPGYKTLPGSLLYHPGIKKIELPEIALDYTLKGEGKPNAIDYLINKYMKRDPSTIISSFFSLYCKPEHTKEIVRSFLDACQSHPEIVLGIVDSIFKRYYPANQKKFMDLLNKHI